MFIPVQLIDLGTVVAFAGVAAVHDLRIKAVPDRMTDPAAIAVVMPHLDLPRDGIL
jgi:hypothetical protein